MSTISGDRRQQPAVRRPRNATGVLTETPDGISIELPPMGFFAGSKGLGSFSLMWSAFVAVFAGALIVGTVRRGPSGGDWFLFAIAGVFGVIGVVMILAALRSGARRGIVDVVGPDLMITRRALGRPVSEHWAVADLIGVEASKSGVEINNKPVLHLAVRLRDGTTRGFFPERADKELRWVAAAVESSLGLASLRSQADGATGDPGP
ncbi:MAG: hypothetical protein AAGA55_02845 [Planctomycetota bacterium]